MRAGTTLALVFLFFVSVLTQGLEHDWNAVKALSAGATLRIQQLGGRQVEGRLVSVNDAVITIVANGRFTGPFRRRFRSSLCTDVSRGRENRGCSCRRLFRIRRIETAERRKCKRVDVSRNFGAGDPT